MKGDRTMTDLDYAMIKKMEKKRGKAYFLNVSINGSCDKYVISFAR